MADWTVSLPMFVEEHTLRRALADALRISPYGIELSKVERDDIPVVVMTTEDGITEITAVSGAVKVIHADMDREASSLTSEAVEGILTHTLHDGTRDDVIHAVDSAREGLSRFVAEDLPTP